MEQVTGDEDGIGDGDGIGVGDGDPHPGQGLTEAGPPPPPLQAAMTSAARAHARRMSTDFPDVICVTTICMLVDARAPTEPLAE